MSAIVRITDSSRTSRHVSAGTVEKLHLRGGSKFLSLAGTSLGQRHGGPHQFVQLQPVILALALGRLGGPNMATATSQREILVSAEGTAARGLQIANPNPAPCRPIEPARVPERGPFSLVTRFKNKLSTEKLMSVWEPTTATRHPSRTSTADTNCS
jgi:hypothetical protein